MNSTDPIAAIATAPGRGGIGVLRVSGKALWPLLADVLNSAPPARVAHYGPFIGMGGEEIDRGIALWFPAPHSYTGEDVLELQGHGGPVVMQRLLARVLQLGAPRGLRLARPGEFTERAYLNGKLDLAQAEAVADLIDASTEAAARAAMRLLEGHLSRGVLRVVDELIALRTLVEATLDFPEEEIDFLKASDALGRLRSIDNQLQTLLLGARQGAVLRNGLSIVLVGAPNVGKSSLLNALAGADVAIVTPYAGTTRDRVTQAIDIDGVLVHVIDTAGLRATDDPVELIGIDRTWAAIDAADAVLLLDEQSATPVHGATAPPLENDSLSARILARVQGRVPVVHIQTKADLLSAQDTVGRPAQEGHLLVSAHTGEGLNALKRQLLAMAGWQAGQETPFLARERHVQALQRAAGHVADARLHADQADRSLELFAEELRGAQSALDQITGAFSADDLLGEIFSRFCIGK